MTQACTLFEGDYHRGLAVLANSLYSQGYRGTLWAGYRGPLPPWAVPIERAGAGAVFRPADGLAIAFLPIATTAHLTNYKPDFMLELLSGQARDGDSIFYFDPDIVIGQAWRFFEEWVTCGVAVCEDVNSPLAEHHPRREGWRRYFGSQGVTLHPRTSYYANGGAVGVRRSDIEFLTTWKRIQNLTWKEIGGAEYAGIPGGKSLSGRSGFANCFGQPDQDALNAAMEAVPAIRCSFLDRQAMGFMAGEAVVPHAVGPEKPWRKKYIRSALQGRLPRAVDKAYWRFAQGPNRAFTAAAIRRRRVALMIAAAIGRFIRRA